MLVRMLISKGFACREAEDGVEGLSEMSLMNQQSSYNFNPFSGVFSRSCLCILCIFFTFSPIMFAHPLSLSYITSSHVIQLI